MARGNRSALVTPVLLAACVAAFFLLFLPPALRDSGPMRISASYDFHSFFLPKFIYGSEELRAFRFPLWNPYEDGGVPFFATAQPALLYPPKAILFGLLPPVPAYVAFLVIHYLALAFGFLLFVRGEGVSPAAAFAGAAVWTFSVPNLLSNYHPTRIANMAFLPVFFVLAERLAKGGGRKSFALLAVAVAFQLLAGYPECAVDAGIVLAVHAAVRYGARQWPTSPLRSVPLLAAAFVSGALLAAVQLVPLVEAAVAAGREVVAAVVRVHQPDIPERLAAPALFSVPGLAVFSWIALFEKRARSPAILVFLCIFLGRWGWAWLERLPGFSMLRFPYVWLEMSPFFVAWLTSIGVDSFFGEGATSRRGATVALAAVLVASTLWGAFSLYDGYALAAGLPEPTGVLGRLARNVSTVTGAALGVAGSVALVAVALFGRGAAARAKGGLAATLVCLCLVVSHLAAYPFGGRSSPFSRPGSKGEIAGYLDEDLPLHGRALSMHDIQYGYSVTDRLPSLLGAEESFVPLRFRRVLEYFELWPFFGHLDWVRVVAARGFLDAMNVELVAVPPEIVPYIAESALEPVRRGADSLLLRNPTPMGPAWVTYGVRMAATPTEAFEYVLGTEFEPASEVVLEKAPRHYFPQSTDLPPTRATEHRSSATDVAYDVTLPRPGLLVASESLYPGWTVTVDGAPAEILAANYVQRGVELEAGHHVARFRYAPRSVIVGALTSLLAVAALVGFVFVRRRPATAGAS